MNPVGWFEIAVKDLERAKEFYGQVFQTEFEFVDMPGAPMYMFASDPEWMGAGGALVKSEDNTPSTEGVTIYFNCEDADTEASRVHQAGGQVIMPKTSLGEFGFMAMFLDTEGNRIGLHSMK